MPGMSRSSIFVFILAICNTPAISPAAERVWFEDRFENELGEGWSWIRENAAHWCVRDQQLAVRVVPGDAGTVENALVREAPDRSRGTYAIEVTVTNESDPTEQYEQAGLTWYLDGKPVFKLVKERVDGQLMIIPGRQPIENRPIQLRLIVKADSYTAQYRLAGEPEFVTAAEGKLPPPGKDQISIQCYHGPANAEHWIRFDDFRIVELDNRE